VLIFAKNHFLCGLLSKFFPGLLSLLRRVVDTLKAFNMDSSIGTPVEAVARAYEQVLEGAMNGEVLDAV
jgi:hypothetical protein